MYVSVNATVLDCVVMVVGVVVVVVVRECGVAEQKQPDITLSLFQIITAPVVICEMVPLTQQRGKPGATKLNVTKKPTTPPPICPKQSAPPSFFLFALFCFRLFCIGLSML